MKSLWVIYDYDAKDYVRELPSKVDDGGTAILAFASRYEARKRAAKYFGFMTYKQAHQNNWCEVRKAF